MSQLRGTPLQELGRRRRSPLGDVPVRLIREKPLGVVGGIIVLILLFCGIFAGVLSPYEIDDMNVRNRFAAPSMDYLLGADQIGRDILSRLIHGARVSLIVGLAASTVNILVAATIGVPSGFFGGKFDIVMQRFVDAWMAFPGLLVLLTVMSIVGRGMSQIILVLGVTGGIGASRIIRSAVIGIKENEYFVAADAIGSPSTATLMRHVMPNITAPIIVVFSVSIGWAIMAEAGLSFLGFGLPPEIPSWGGMLSGEGRRYMEIKPSLALFPGIALATVIYGVNMFGDAIRDLLDPRLRGGER
jgi:peptide/nickel transport system permease protein